MHRLLPLLIICLAASLATAAPLPYRLDTTRSTVAFTYDLQGRTTEGRMPVKSADIRIDLHEIGRSTVSVTLDARRARAGFIFATRAMKGPDILDTARHPEIRFRSTRIRGSLSAATVTGDLTLRGITRPVTLAAGLYRQRGTAPDDLDQLTVLMTGRISRSAFGATGFAGMVGDAISLRIIARIGK